MLPIKLSLFVSALVVLAGLLAGCASEPKQTTATTRTQPAQGVRCEKCQVTWTQVPNDVGKGRIVGYTTRKTMECPDCRSAVQNFFATGKLEHTCATCGPDAMQICDVH
jgi:hypothetical protein